MADDMDLRPFSQQGEDRLPWLETVEPDEPEGASPVRALTAILLGLIVLAAVVFGIWKLQHRPQAADGQLIAAQEGDYKVKPDDPGGLKVQGEGDSAIATSAGKGAGNGAIDLKQVPEAPVAGKHAAVKADHAAGGGANAVAQVPAAGGKLVAAAPIAAHRPTGPGSASGGSLVQLGAYPSEAAATAAWSEFAKRFAYLAPYGKSVQPVATGGRTLYRLRVNTGSANQAADVCGKLRVAGESCFVAS